MNKKEGFINYDNVIEKPIDGKAVDNKWIIDNMKKPIETDEGGLVLLCKGIQLYPERFNTLGQSIESLVEHLKEILCDSDFKAIEKDIRILQSNFEALEKCNIHMYLY